MDIQYHYFVIKTLARYSGFDEDEAQTIAYYSQQVDNYTNHMPLWVEGQPPKFFTENGYAQKKTDSLWMVVPHPTGIDVLQSLEKHYRHTTLSPFHFIPPRTFKELESQDGFTRADYRCVCASEAEKAVLIHGIVDEAVGQVQTECCERSLMQLGMALHTYADTYAHCGYSGLDGWENKAVIKKAFNKQTQKEEVSKSERLVYRQLPHIGHCNTAHVPDICSYQIDTAMLKNEEDTSYSAHIVRDNLDTFLTCSRDILEIMCDAFGTQPISKQAWKELSGKLLQAMAVPSGKETKTDYLIPHWNKYFPEITYEYEKNQRFYRKGACQAGKTNSLVHYPTQAFYDFNELAYGRAEKVLGTAKQLETNKRLLTEALRDTEGTRKSAEFLMDTAAENTAAVQWEPKTELGAAVRAVGFEYVPRKDIICSAMNNIQRTAGYCKGYDEAAPSIISIIDCEPIYFLYDGYEWLLELWKGQYGIETGCGIGLYYRQADKPETEIEKNVTGKLYDCVPDSLRIGMSFSLCRDGMKLFGRDWTEHWWLTGFQWGIFSQPEELEMSAGLRFPTTDMKKAFLEGTDNAGQTNDTYGLKALGYSFRETDGCTVSFNYTKPHTAQPAPRDQMRGTIQKLNSEMTQVYNEMKEKYRIPNNDPNVIEEVFTKQAGTAGKNLYDKLLWYYGRKAEHRNNIRCSAVSV